MAVKDSVEAFFAAIAPCRAAYTEACLSFAALRVAEGFSIIQGRLYLAPVKVNVPTGFVETPHIWAGSFDLGELGKTPSEAIADLLAGRLETPIRPLLFPGNSSGDHGGYFQDFHPDGLQSQERLPAVTLLGGSLQEALVQPQLDWEMKAAEQPHETLQELLYTYKLGNLRADVATIEVAALRVVNVDLGTRITGNRATLSLRKATQLPREKAAIGYRSLNKTNAQRGILRGTDLDWRVEDDVEIGSGTVEVEPASAVHAYGIYDGVAHHQGWIFDPENAQNARRAAYEAFDAGLPTLTELLSKTSGRGNRREVEAAVGWLLWMLGFSVAHLGDTSKMQDGPDLIATTQTGHFAVIEITTGVLKADNKLAHLVDRTEAVRRRLQSSNNAGARVMPVIVTTKSRMEVRADLEQAERLGVLVITREVLETATTRTLVQPDADRIFAEGEQTIAEGLSKHSQQLTIPGVLGQ